LRELLASVLAGGQAITTRIADQAAVYLSASGDAEQAQIALDLLPAAVAYVDVEQCVRYASRQCGTWFAIASGATCGRHLREVLDTGLYEHVQGCLEAALQGAEATCEARFDRDGVRALSATFLPDHDRAGRVRGVVCFLQDVSERRRSEAHVLRGQKLESAATMAGGLAHDFNNLLTVILGNISLASLQANDETRLRASLGEAQEAIERARCLTRELLMLARVPRPITDPRPIGPLLHESAGMAVRGSTARAEFVLPDDLWSVDFDAELLGEAFRSLMANAVQAMPLGGALRVVAKNTWLPEPGAGNRRRPYVKVSIVDRGIGIPEGHLSKIFDPYFTTKQAGSGLSLATAYAVIERHRGMVDVSSKMGAGTCVCVYLPVAGNGEASAAEHRSELCRDQAPPMLPPLCENLATTAAAFVGVAAKAQGEA
jgi:PAS domain S-box-containing protein